jgi:hypothetical protein
MQRYFHHQIAGRKLLEALLLHRTVCNVPSPPNTGIHVKIGHRENGQKRVLFDISAAHSLLAKIAILRPFSWRYNRAKRIKFHYQQK